MILSGKFDLTFFVSPGAKIEIQGDQKDFPFVEVVSEDEFNQGMMELQHLNLKELKEINVLHDALNDAVLAMIRWPRWMFSSNKMLCGNEFLNVQRSGLLLTRIGNTLCGYT